MATITKQLLSGSTNGKAIQVSGNATASAVTVHTAVGNATDFDEVWIWATNHDTSAIILTLEWGVANDVAYKLVVTVAASSTELVCPGLIIQNSLVVEAFAGTANKINLFGYVNRLDY